MLGRFRIQKKELLYSAGIFLVAFLIRFIYLIQIKQNFPLFDAPVMDAKDYHQWALNIILTGPWFGPQPYWKPPLYPYFLAVLYKTFGYQFFVTRLIQIIIGSFSCVLVWFLGKRVFGKKVGLIAGIIASLYGTLVYFDCELLPPVIIIFLNLLLLLFLTGTEKKVTKRGWFFAGTFLGLSALSIPNTLFFIPLVAIWLIVVFWRSRSIRYIASCLFLFIFGIILIIAPVTLKQKLMDKNFVLISYNVGINFYIGNNPNADGVSTPPIGIAWQRLLNKASKAGYFKPADSGAFYVRLALDFIKGNPSKFIILTLRRLLFFWTAVELRNNSDTYYLANLTSLGRMLVWETKFFAFPFGFVVPLGLLGAVLSVKYRKNNAPILLIFFILANMAAVCLMSVNARYRLPIVPPLIIFAAYALFWYYEQFKGRLYRPILLSLPGLLFFILLVNGTVPQMSASNKRELYYDYYIMGNVYITRGETEKALENYRKAVTINPRYPDVYNMLGDTYWKMGRYAEAEKYLKRAIELAPDFARSHYLMGDIYMKRGDYESAASEFKSASLFYDQIVTAESFRELGRLYSEYLHNPHLAIKYFKKYLEVSPGAPDADKAREEIRRLSEFALIK